MSSLHKAQNRCKVCGPLCELWTTPAEPFIRLHPSGGYDVKAAADPLAANITPKGPKP